MKKTLLFAAIAALFTLAACQKDEIPFNNEEEIPVIEPVALVFTAGIDQTKTTVTSEGKISWALHDEVSITDGSSVTALYEVSAIDGDGKATLTPKDGEQPVLGAGPYAAVYGTDPATVQTYTGEIPSLPMSANSETTEFTFRVTCCLFEATLTKAGESIKSIAVSDGSNTYTLVCRPAVSIESAQKFYMAVPAGHYTTFTFTNSGGVACIKTKSAGFDFAVNTIQPMALSSALSFPTHGAMSKIFTVGVGPDGIAGNEDDIKVRFSTGNLQYQASTYSWRFAEHQYDFIGASAGNTTTAENRGTQSDWIDLFGWAATGINKNGASPYSASTTYGDYKTNAGASSNDEVLTLENKGDWGVCIGNGWRSLSYEEWSFLLGTTAPRTQKKRQMSTVSFTPELSVYGLIIMPDDWDGSPSMTINTSQSDWETLETKGAVFLPDAGQREDTTIQYTDNGYYWATMSVNNQFSECLLLKKSEHAAKLVQLSRHIGCSVRLVIDN